MPFKIQREVGKVTIPKAFLEDKNLSTTAKGLLACVYVSGDTELNKEDKDYLKPFVLELLQAGYLENMGSYLKVLNKPKKPKKEKELTDKLIEKAPKQTFFSKIMKAVDEFTSNEELRLLLKDYFVARQNRKPGTRFERSFLNGPTLERMLNELKELPLQEQIDVVRLSLEKQYLKWVLPEKDAVNYKPQSSQVKKSADGLKLERRTKEDLDEEERQKQRLLEEGAEWTGLIF